MTTPEEMAERRETEAPAEMTEHLGTERPEEMAEFQRTEPPPDMEADPETEIQTVPARSGKRRRIWRMERLPMGKPCRTWEI